MKIIEIHYRYPLPSAFISKDEKTAHDAMPSHDGLVDVTATPKSAISPNEKASTPIPDQECFPSTPRTSCVPLPFLPEDILSSEEMERLEKRAKSICLLSSVSWEEARAAAIDDVIGSRAEENLKLERFANLFDAVEIRGLSREKMPMFCDDKTEPVDKKKQGVQSCQHRRVSTLYGDNEMYQKKAGELE